MPSIDSREKYEFHEIMSLTNIIMFTAFSKPRAKKKAIKTLSVEYEILEEKNEYK